MPDWKKIVQERIASLQLDGSSETDLAEEVSQHLQDRYRELCDRGMSPEEAFRETQSELEDLGQLRRKTGPARQPVSLAGSTRGSVAADAYRDLRYALRSLRKSPLFTAFVILTLGLAIGANTTVFTLINTLLLNPLPVPHSSELVAVSSAKLGNHSKSSTPIALSYADFKDIQTKNTVFRSLAGFSAPRGVTWRSDNSSKGLFVELVTTGYFSTLDLRPVKGRFFRSEEDSAARANPVAVINYGAWQTHFGGESDIVGKTLQLNSVVVTIVGVAPRRFIGVNAIFGPDLWIPSAMAEQLFPTEMGNVFADRGKPLFQGIGRLRPQVTALRAEANLSALAADLAREYPVTDEGRTVVLSTVRDLLFATSSTSATPVLLGSAGLLIVVGIVLLIACSNVANLLLARAAGRQHEMAVRLAIGANRRRLLRQLLTESALLGLLSGMAGLFVAYAGLHLLFAALPSSANFIAPKFDSAVFAFALIVSLATGVLFGTLPAWKASGVPLAATLKEEVRTAGRSGRKVTIANGLLVGQVAFSFLLLMTAALFLRSIDRAYGMDPGFQTAHLAMFMTSPGQAGFDRVRTKAFYKEVRERVARIPQVESLSWASNLPLWTRPITLQQVEGRPRKFQAETITAILNTVDRDYFETAGVPMEAGRPFTTINEETTAPVAIVNERLAAEYWPGQNAIGKRIQLPGERNLRQVIGVAGNAFYTSWGEAPQPCVYVPLEQKYSDGMILYVRARQTPPGSHFGSVFPSTQR